MIGGALRARADRLAGAVLLADALLPVLPALHPLRVQGLPDRRARATSAAPAARCMIDNTHVVVLRGTGADMVPVPEMAAFARALRLRLRGAREGRRQPLGARRAALRLHREQLPRRPRLRRLGRPQPRRRARGATRSTPSLQRHLHASRARALRRRAAARSSRCPSGCPRSTALHQRIVDVEGYVNVHTQSLLGALPADRPAASRCARPRTASTSSTARAQRRRARAGARAASTRGSPTRSTGRRAAQGRAKSAPPPEEQALLAARARARRLRRRAQAARRRPRHAARCAGCCALVREYPREPLPGRGRARPRSTASSTSTGSSAWCSRRSPPTTSCCPTDDDDEEDDDDR